jgi:hypothetical protein
MLQLSEVQLKCDALERGQSEHAGLASSKAVSLSCGVILWNKQADKQASKQTSALAKAQQSGSEDMTDQQLKISELLQDTEAQLARALEQANEQKRYFCEQVCAHSGSAGKGYNKACFS